MKAIWKYAMPIEDQFSVDMPEDAEIIAVQVQRDVPCAWCKVDPSTRQTERRLFRWVGTGHEHPDSYWQWLVYRGSVQLEGGALVFHLFEVMPC